MANRIFSRQSPSQSIRLYYESIKQHGVLSWQTIGKQFPGPSSPAVAVSFDGYLVLMLLLLEQIRRSPVDLVNIPSFTGFHTSQVVFSPDFFQQQSTVIHLERSTLGVYPGVTRWERMLNGWLASWDWGSSPS